MEKEISPKIINFIFMAFYERKNIGKLIFWLFASHKHTAK